MKLDRQNDPLMQTCEQANQLIKLAEETFYPVAATFTADGGTIEWCKINGIWRLSYTDLPSTAKPRPASECTILQKFALLNLLPQLQASIEKRRAELLLQGKATVSLAQKFLDDLRKGT